MPVPDEQTKEKANQGVVGHLQAPKKKRKNYIVLAFNPKFDPELARQIKNAIRLELPALSLASPTSEKEFKRAAGRQLSVVVIDNNFIGEKETIQILKELKIKKQVPVPVLFLTEDQDRLIELYHKYLLPFQETDEFINIDKSNTALILAKIKSIINQKSPRKSRRYPVNIDLTYTSLAHNKTTKGKLIDMSVHGGVLVSKEDEIFKVGDQLKVSIPVNNLIKGHTSDFMKIPAKVRRLFINGNKVSLSWEYLSEQQTYKITEFITEMVNSKTQQDLANKRTAILIKSKGK